MKESVLIEFFGDYPFIRVIDFLIERRGFDYSKTDIAKGAGIGLTTLHLIWNKIERIGLLKNTRTYGNTKLYMLNEENVLVQRIMKLELDLMKFYGKIESEQAELIKI